MQTKYLVTFSLPNDKFKHRAVLAGKLPSYIQSAFRILFPSINVTGLNPQMKWDGGEDGLVIGDGPFGVAAYLIEDILDLS